MDKNKIAKELLSVAKSLIADTKESFIIMVDYISMDVTEDKYEEGEVGRRTQVLFERNQGSFKTMQEVVKHASSITGIPEKDFAIYDDDQMARITGQGMVDENNNYVGDNKLFQQNFKEGAVRAWSADVTVGIRFAKVWHPTVDEIKEISNLKVI